MRVFLVKTTGEKVDGVRVEVGVRSGGEFVHEGRRYAVGDSADTDGQGVTSVRSGATGLYIRTPDWSLAGGGRSVDVDPEAESVTLEVAPVTTTTPVLDAPTGKPSAPPKKSTRIILTDVFTGAGAPGVRVEAGVLVLNTFVHGGQEYAVACSEVTDPLGRVSLHGGRHALNLRSRGWSMLDSGDGHPTADIDLDRAEYRFDVVNEEPVLPPDLPKRVSRQLGRTDAVRILVMPGMHFGCQAAVLELIRDLRRVDYRGPIVVRADTEPMPYDSRYRLRYDLGPKIDGSTFQAMLAASLVAKYPGPAEVEVEEPVGKHGEAYVGLMAQKTTQYDIAPSDLADALLKTCPHVVRLTVTDATGKNSVTVGSDVIEFKSAFEVTLTIRSISEISNVAKLDILEPNRDRLAMYHGVTWEHGTSFDTTGDSRVVGMLACGEYTHKMTDDAISKALGTPIVVALQPSNWKVNDRYVRVDGKVHHLALPRAATYPTAPIATADPTTLVTEALGPERKALAGRILTLLKAVSSGAVDLMVCYGLHQVKAVPPATELKAEPVLANVRAALATAGAGTKKPCVVLSLYRYDLAGDFAGQPGLLDMGEATGITWVHEKAPLPQSVFQLLYEASTMPLIIGGANTSNLVRMLGKPHLSVEGGTPFAVLGHDGHLAVLELEKLLRTPDLPSNGVATLAKFFAHANAAPGEVCDGYFAVLRAWLRDPKRDQLSLSLYKLDLLNS